MVYFRVPGFRFSVHNKLVLPRLSCTSSRAQHAVPGWGLRGSQHGHKMMDLHTYLHTYIHTGIQMKTRRYTDKQTNRQTYMHTCMHAYIHVPDIDEFAQVAGFVSARGNRTQSLCSPSRPGPLDRKLFRNPNMI